MKQERPKFYPIRRDGQRFYAGDARDVLAYLAGCPKGKGNDGERPQLVFIDPPFNIGRKGYDVCGDDMPPWQYSAFLSALCIQSVQWLRPGGSLWLNVPDHVAAIVLREVEPSMVLNAGAHDVTMRDWCIWHYRFGQNRQSAFVNSKCHLLHYVKADAGGGHQWNPEAVLVPSDRASRYSDPRTQTKADGGVPGMRVPLDVWSVPRIQGNNRERWSAPDGKPHDNQMPLEILHRIVLANSSVDDLVADPCCGSGTTAVACEHLGRRFVGIDLSSVYSTSAANRAAAQGDSQWLSEWAKSRQRAGAELCVGTLRAAGLPTGSETYDPTP